MTRNWHFPLLIKVCGWLVLHLIILALAFTAFVRWQLHLGLDSLLSGAAGERLTSFGDEAVARMKHLAPSAWQEGLDQLAAVHRVDARIFPPQERANEEGKIPENVRERSRAFLPPPRGGPPHEGPRRPAPPWENDQGKAEEGTMPVRKSRALFLMRGDDDAYWAGIFLELPPRARAPRRPLLLLVSSPSLDGAGMFFDFKPWLWGGLAVLGLSVVVWVPFVWSISRYLKTLRGASHDISAGKFQLSLPQRRDELGQLGQSLEAMASRLDLLIGGQKRFLRDAAHELCAPLARMRTALSIVEQSAATPAPELLRSLDADAAELAMLVEEILSFSRVGSTRPVQQEIDLTEFLRDLISRYGSQLQGHLNVPESLTLMADPKLLTRALSNLIRNAQLHAGADRPIELDAQLKGAEVEVRIMDHGPGVPESELKRIFEPFHRLDPARGRETGGTGLGLAIVRTCVESCGGEVSASNRSGGGLCVTIRLPVRRQIVP